MGEFCQRQCGPEEALRFSITRSRKRGTIKHVGQAAKARDYLLWH